VNVPTTRKRTTLAELDKDVSAQRATPRVRSRSAGFGAGVLAEIDQLKGTSGQSRKRGVFALLQTMRGKARADVAAARAYDLGAPIRVSGAYADAFAASLGADDAGAWASVAYGSDDPLTPAFTVELFDRDEVTAPPAPIAPIPAAVPVPLSVGQAEDGVLGLDLSAVAAKDPDDSDQFEREVQAILSGKTARPAPRPSGLSGAPDQQASSTAPATFPPAPHRIFEEMGQNMAYATAFHLPPMELGKRFDDIEREIALEEAPEARPSREYSLDLTDDDISRSLGLPHGLATEAPPQTQPPPIGADAPVVSDPPASARVDVAPPAPQPTGGPAAVTTPVDPGPTPDHAPLPRITGDRSHDDVV
jgi:hypothetical protein